MKILLTGSSGFVGKHVLTELLKYSHTVIISTTDTSKTFISDNNDRFEKMEFNINFADNYGNLMRYFGYPDMLIHLAWQGLPNYNESIHDEQLIGHYKFIKNLVENGMKKIVASGTCLEYGLQEGCLAETMKSNPILPYAIAKTKLCDYIGSLQKQHRFKFNWLRLFYMYGEGQNTKSILSQLENAIKNKQHTFNMSKGEQQRDYLPIEKVAEYIVKVALQKKIEGIINCCSGKPITIFTLVQEYLNKHHAEIKLNLGCFPYPDYEPFSFYGDTQKLNLALGNNLNK